MIPKRRTFTQIASQEPQKLVTEILPPFLANFTQDDSVLAVDEIFACSRQTQTYFLSFCSKDF